jgi:2'-5' RNA ligase
VGNADPEDARPYESGEGTDPVERDIDRCARSYGFFQRGFGLGEQSDERLVAAEAALADAAAGSAPLDVTFHGVGAFPGLERPRILWVGLAQGALDARRLQARVTDALDARGFAREERAWHPHLTIGRVHDERRWRREAGPPLRSALAQVATTTFGTQRVTELALMRSDLSPSGARYHVRRLAPLSGA